MEALELIDNLKKTYADLETYRDAGTTTVRDAKTEANREPKQHFQTSFRKPANYRCQCDYELPEDADDFQKSLLAGDGILWSDGEQSKHYSRLGDKTETFQDPAHLFGPSLDPIFKGKAQVPDLIARMLMPSIFKEYDQFPLAKEYWSIVGSEAVGEVDCFQVTQDLMVYKEMLWIAKSDFTLRRHARDIDYSFLDHPKVKTLIDTGSKMVRYFFKQFPDINKEILDRGPRHYRTEFHEILLNQPIADEQLAFR
ncbi:MAG: hypothetical protein JSS83_23805 [Cyanobacteria bacterium SZAS LIN-3]|nr:hypothetical protein [Cyanobacteria bacterium SZAS LIN-3]MBS2008341.1 hypothetical protein [Cyanobacteria bacterium SZAS TMP-1]